MVCAPPENDNEGDGSIVMGTFSYCSPKHAQRRMPDWKQKRFFHIIAIWDYKDVRCPYEGEENAIWNKLNIT